MKKTLQTRLVLRSPEGKSFVPAQISYECGDDIVHPKSEISLVYEEREYKGKGTDWLWTDTFADLEMNLPKDVRVACCMTCRHGNMCPYGNAENQLFCTKDLKINSREDVCDLFDGTDSFDQRAVVSFHFCEDFVYQSDECYTYNDYLYQLNKKKTLL